MAIAEEGELVERFQQFYRDYCKDAIGTLAQKYPKEEKSLSVDWQQLHQYDPDLADDYLQHPEEMAEYAEEALRLYDLPVDISLGQAHVRVQNLPEATDIRAIRARHVNTLVAVQGLVRKATDVRPKIQEAAFECQRCGTLSYIPQTGGDFQEPHECQGCERQGPFRINFDQSEFIDAQKLRVQESPEGLRGGETPQSLDVHIEDDITGEVSPGDHVTVTGVLRIEQQGSDQDKSRMFDLFMDGHSVVLEDAVFEDMDITEEDKRRIIDLSSEDDIYEQMVASIAPSIYGYDQEKLAMMLQLFSGVTKHLPDGSRIRGDLHMLLIGDPGTGKCLKGDARVTLADGREVEIRDLVEENLDDPVPVDDGVYQEVDVPLPTLDFDGEISEGRATKVWKREAPDRMYRIRTATGKGVEVTPSHPLFVPKDGRFEPVVAEELSEGQFVATPGEIPTEGDDSLDVEYRESESPNAVRIDLPEKWTPALARLVGYVVAEGHAVLRDDHTGDVRITNNEEEVLEDVRNAIKALGLNYTERGPRAGKDAREIMCCAGEFASFLAELEPAILDGSADQRVPDAVMSTSPGIKASFLKAFIEGEGHVSASQREISVASMSRELLENARSLLLSLGITSQLAARHNGSYRLRISGKNFERYIDRVGFVTERKSNAVDRYEETAGNTNLDVVPNVGDELGRIRDRLHLSQFDCGLPRSTYQHYERGDRNPSRESLRAVVEAFENRLEWLHTARQRVANGDWDAIEAVRTELDISQRQLAERMGVEQTAVSYYERNSVAPDGGRTVDAKDFVLNRIDDALGISDDVDALRTLVNGAVAWDRIERIDVIEPDYDWVYDLEVEGTHNYLTNNVVSHNSQLLQYIREVAPRSVYTSGKGSSTAGLCVAGDTVIHTEDGFKPIRDIVTDELPDSVNDETAVEKAIGIPTVDRDSGTVIDSVSSHVWRMPEKPCRRIETGHGKEIEASVNTPILTCGTDGIEWREISEIEPGDNVAVPQYDDLGRSEIPVRRFLELTTEKILLSDDSVAFLRESLREEFGTLRDAAAELDLSEDFIYLHLKNRHVPLAKLDRILDDIGANRDDVSFDRLMIRHGDSITIPETFDQDLMYLLGLVFGDGDISLDRRGGNRGMVRVSNSDESLLERAAAIFDAKFDKRPEIEHQEERVPCIRVNSATIARLFANAGMRTPKADLALAPELTVAKHADAFLRGLMDADGAVSARDEGGSSVLLSTISPTLAQQVQLMLETYGVRARARERDRRGTYELANGYTFESKHVQHFIEIYGRDLERYAEAVGFECAEKQAALETIVGGTERRGEKIPVGSALAAVEGTTGDYHTNVHRGDNPGRERARSMLDDIELGPVEPLVREAVEADLRWDEVVVAEDTGEKEVFDLTVPGTHNFIGNGIVTHNTAAAVRDDFAEGQQWSLEAGALVMADQGIAAVDELDKMRCVTGDTLVHLGDGRVRRIRDLAHDASQSGEIEPLANGRTIRDVDLDAWTMTDGGRLVRRPVTAIHEYDAPDDLTSVRLESGEELTATRDHPFFVFEEGRRVERPAADLGPGDWVYVPRSLAEPAADGGTVAASTPTDPTGSGVSPALGAVAGYLSGDGNVYYDREAGVYGIRFTNKEEQLLADFKRACREAFGADPVRPPSERRDDGVETVRLPGREYADAVLDAGMNLENYDGKAFPDGITGGGSTTKAAFVRAVADSEGTVDTATGNVRISSSSYELLAGVKHLLLEWGVSCQIQTRERDGKRDLHVLAITAAESLVGFNRHVGFTLKRKQAALNAVCESASGDRTIIDVIPNCGDLLSSLRGSLRLHQSECGIDDVTYCNFENGDANVSIRLAREILAAFEERKRTAKGDLEILDDADGGALERLKEQYHVPQAELADGTAYSQQQVSRLWGESDDLHATVADRLREIVESVAETDLEPFRSLVRGDVKWRRVDAVETVAADAADGRVELLAGELADLLDCRVEDAVEAGRDLLAAEPNVDSWEALRGELDRYGISFADLARDLGVSDATVSRWFNGVVTTDRFPEVRDVALERIEEIRDEVARLLDRIEARGTPKVYDLTVAGTHNFVADGMVVHNSEDRSALHEGLEQQKISISKAGINATLKARCSLLGAANPKYGRFDQYEPIGEQIDLEPALISRFDLIFTVTDQPDPEHDRKLADHILTTNYAGELHTQSENLAAANVTTEEVDAATEDVEPAIDAKFLRKYVAHAKRSCFPTMTDEAMEAIREFYVDLRSKGLDEDAPVPVTARQLEALVRLAEASARVRLADRVEESDAERVIEIVRSCLQDIGVDPETGQFDADVVETGRSKSQRDRVKNIRALIGEIEAEYDEGAPVDVVLDRAEEIGLERSKAEHEIEKLKQKGEVYEPSTDHLRTT